MNNFTKFGLASLAIGTLTLSASAHRMPTPGARGGGLPEVSVTQPATNDHVSPCCTDQAHHIHELDKDIEVLAQYNLLLTNDVLALQKRVKTLEDKLSTTN